MSDFRRIVLATAMWACGAGGVLADPSILAVGDAMPKPNKEHFVVTFTIKCTDTDSARVDRYEHRDETAVIAYRNASNVPYGYYMVHTNTLLLDNDPQDGQIDSIAVLSMGEDIKICGVLPQ
jgi:hypothetical protein